MPITYGASMAFIAKSAVFDTLPLLGVRDFSLTRQASPVQVVTDGNPDVAEIYTQGEMESVSLNVSWVDPAILAKVGKKATLTIVAIKRDNSGTTGVGGTPADHEETYSASAVLLAVRKGAPAPDGGMSSATLDFAVPL